MRRVSAAGALVLLIGVMAGCTPVKPPATGSVFEDERLEKEALSRVTSRHLGNAHVNVAGMDRRLLLTGEVPDQAARSEVEKLVSGIPNVRGVSNELVVGDIIGLSARTSDSVIASDVKFRFLKDATFPASQVKIVTEDGTVFLMGSVHRAEGAAAAELARTVKGVKRVVLVFDYAD